MADQVLGEITKTTFFMSYKGQGIVGSRDRLRPDLQGIFYIRRSTISGVFQGYLIKALPFNVDNTGS